MQTIKNIGSISWHKYELSWNELRKKEVSIDFLLKKSNVKIFLIKSFMRTLDSVDGHMPQLIGVQCAQLTLCGCVECVLDYSFRERKKLLSWIGN